MVLAVIKKPVTEGRKGHGGGSCQTVAVFLFVAGGVSLPREAHFLDFLVRAVLLLAVERDVVQRGAVFLVAVHVGRACLRHVLHLLDAGGVPVCLGRSWLFLSVVQVAVLVQTVGPSLFGVGAFFFCLVVGGGVILSRCSCFFVAVLLVRT